MDEAGIFAFESPYLERYVQVGVAGGRVISVSFPRAPDEEAEIDDEPGDRLALLSRIQRYLEGEHDDFSDVDVGLTVPTRQRAVLEALRGVPYGEQVSVDRLAAMTPDLDPEDDADQDLVREALAENPAPLLIADHRVRDGPSAAPPDIEQKLRALEGL